MVQKHAVTPAGLRVKAMLDKRNYPTGVKTSDAAMKALSLHVDDYRGDWNYALHPRARVVQVNRISLLSVLALFSYWSRLGRALKALD